MLLRSVQISLESFFLAKLFKLFVLQSSHDPVQREDLLPLSGRHQSRVLSSDVEGEDGVADFEAGKADRDAAVTQGRFS